MYWTYLAVLAVSFICSLIDFRRHSHALKIFCIFLGLTVLTETLANIAIKFHWETDYVIYNSFMLPEYCLYTLFFRSIIRTPRIKKALTVFLFLCPVIWSVTTWRLGITTWNSYMILIGDAATVGMCAWFLFEVFASEELIDLTTSAEFWITASTFMYCCCEIPITGRLNFLANDKRTTLLLEDVLQILNILMYLTIIYAYQCRRLINIMRSWSTAWRA
jgi:hypothetical protein